MPLLRPWDALATLTSGVPVRPLLHQRWVGVLGAGTDTVELTRSADLIGVQWQAPQHAVVELRFRTHGGRWSRWVSAAAHGHGPEAAVPGQAVVGDPVWSGGTTAVQLRARQPVRGVRLHLIDVSGGLGARRVALAGAAASAAASPPLASPVLDAGAGQPPIIARRAWAQGISPPKVAPGYGAVRMAFVHHTENPNGYSPGEVQPMLQAIYVFHRYVNRWNDIGYNFVVDLYGRIFEARAGGIDEPVIGAHAGGYNRYSTGIAVLGSFTSQPISPPARRSLERLLAWKLSLHGVPAHDRVSVRVNPAGASYSRFPANANVSLPRIAGHRDADATDCPGDVLYGQLPSIRAGVAELTPNPTRATLTLAAAPTPAAAGASAAGEPPATSATPEGAQPQPQTELLQGAVQTLSGAPVAAAPIVVQARSVSRKGEVVQERTLAETITDAQGQFSLPAPQSSSPHRTWIRVLYAGTGAGGATVSEPLLLAASAVSPPAVPAPSAPAAVPPPA